MANLTVNNFEELDNSISFANELRQSKTVNQLKDSADITESMTSTKTVEDINSSIDFADDLRKLKTVNEINEGVDKANKAKRKKYSSVSSLLSDSSIELGEIVDTVAYYEGWDVLVNSPVGGNSYLKVAGQAPEEDGGSIIYTSDGNHLKGLFTNNYYEPEQWGARGDGVTVDFNAFDKALKYLEANGKSKLSLRATTYLTSFTVPSGVTVEGSGSSYYKNNTELGATVLKRPTAYGRVVNMSNDCCELRDLDIDGNGGRSSGFGNGIICNGGNYGIIEKVKVLDCNNGFEGNGGSPAGVFLFDHCCFRQNNQGIRNFRDSEIINCIISANYIHGIYSNQGQNSILGCYIEYNRDQANIVNGLPSAANGIYLDGNSTETIIDGCKFDRNSGNDIFINDGAKRVSIGDSNQYKGSAWGAGLTNAQRVSVRVSGSAEIINIPSGLVETRNHGPSPNKGAYSPLGFANLGTSTGVTLGLINTQDSANPMDLNSKDLAWFESSVSGEYYLALGDETAIVSVIHEPDFITIDGVELSSGVAGSLSDGEWSWGDNDSLGFDTVYLKVATGSPSLSIARSHYNQPIIDVSDCTDIQTNSFRDYHYGRLNADSSVTFKMKTRDLLTASQNTKPFVLEINGDQQTSGQNIFARLPFLLKRGAGIGVSVLEGSSTSYNDHAAITIGWSSSGSDTIQVSIVSSPMGDEIEVTVDNTHLSRFADIEAKLLW